MDQRVGINLLIHCTYQVFILGHRNAKVWCPMHTIAPSAIIVWSFCAQVPLNKSHFHRNCAGFTTPLNLSLNSLVKKQSLKQFKVHCWTSFFIFLMRKYPLDKKFIICSNLLFIAVLTYFRKSCWFLEWQPCHYSVRVFCLIGSISQGTPYCSI